MRYCYCLPNFSGQIPRPVNKLRGAYMVDVHLYSYTVLVEVVVYFIAFLSAVWQLISSS